MKDITIEIRSIYEQSYDIFKKIANNEEEFYTDYDLDVYAKYIIEYIDFLEKENNYLRRKIKNKQNQKRQGQKQKNNKKSVYYKRNEML